MIRDSLLSMLDDLVGIQAMGYAEREQDGRAWLREHADDWDLAIVDIFLKQGNGFGVLEACRDRRPGQKMVVLSNYATPEVRRRCRQLGVDGVFDKGTGIDDLIDYCQALRVAAL